MNTSTISSPHLTMGNSSDGIQETGLGLTLRLGTFIKRWTGRRITFIAKWDNLKLSIMELIEKPSRLFTCRRCGSKLKISKPEDIQYGFIKNKDNKEVFGWFIQCPICTKKIIVEIDKHFNRKADMNASDVNRLLNDFKEYMEISKCE